MLTRSQAGIGVACHLGVRSLTGALGSLQNRAGLEGDLEAFCRRTTHRPTDFSFTVGVWARACTVHVPIMCTINSEQFIFTTQAGRKRRLSIVTEKFLPMLTPILLAPENHF